MTEREVLKLALEALTHLQPTALTSFYTIGDRDKAINAIKEALAQPEQVCGFDVVIDETIPQNTFKLAQRSEASTWVGLTDKEASECWTYNDKTSWRNIEAKLKEKNKESLQRTWVGLTDEELKKLQDESWTECEGGGYDWNTFEYARAVEAKLKEKNT